MGEIEHVIVLREERFAVRFDAQRVLQILPFEILRGRCDTQRAAGDIQIGRPPCRSGRPHLRNPPFGRQGAYLRPAVFQTHGLVVRLSRLDLQRAAGTFRDLGGQAVGRACLQLPAGAGFGVDAAVRERIGHMHLRRAAIHRIDHRRGEHPRIAAGRRQRDALRAERQRNGIFPAGRGTESAAVERARAAERDRPVGGRQRDRNQPCVHLLRPRIEPDVGGSVRQREMSARIGSRITEIAVGAQLQFTGRRLILAGRDDGPRPLARHIVVDFVGSFARQFGKSEARRSACGSRFGALHAVDPYPVVGAPQKRNRRAVDGARRRSRGRTGHTGQFDSAAAPNRPCFLFELRGTGRQQQSAQKR